MLTSSIPEEINLAKKEKEEQPDHSRAYYIDN